MKPERLGQLGRSRRANYLLDANIFLELELDQERADACEGVLWKFYLGELQGLILYFAVDTIVIVTENYGK